ncbi:GNAT family N-acetyltransferase [Fructilactobacillus myrtifloralis]|uniref:GNAT family N-acetyltransferase n=1 Tax=Fructilactobacillus myrtifloralis TaxID=2940301 RepID=A0ABY5BMN7_9LACO|nr:GNAT family N-acetyltransferase [Fructilactobacillus myrtifloralis]USS84481.1 GNAT family N-acetyltransferase [Fructilactobacillus myrtifloralis]
MATSTSVFLQPLTTEAADYSLIQTIFQQASTQRFWFQPPLLGAHDVTNFLKQHTTDDRIISQTIQTSQTPHHGVGLVEIIDLDPVARVGEFEIALLNDENGHGYAQAAMAQLLQLAFTQLNLHKLYLYVDVTNAPALHIYQKFGFQIEGTIADQFFAAGAYRDAHYMGLTQADYLNNHH